jgi:nitroreductase
MTLTEAIHARRSIRKYKAQEVTQEQLDALLEAAMLAPSANNGRPWNFVVVRSRDKLDQIAAAHPYAKMLKQATLAIVICGEIDSTDYMSSFFPQDCGAATQNLLLKAVDLGLGTCWCGVYPVEALIKKFRDILGIASIPFNVIAVGVPDENPAQRGKCEAQKVAYL